MAEPLSAANAAMGERSFLHVQYPTFPDRFVAKTTAFRRSGTDDAGPKAHFTGTLGNFGHLGCGRLGTFTGESSREPRVRCRTHARHLSSQALSRSRNVLPILAGEGDTLIPADSIAAILDSASPFPPEMMAPA